MANENTTQEQYLSDTSLKKICIRGVKKIVTECSSVKTLTLATFVALLYFQKIDSYAGMIGILGCIGAKEIDLNQIVNTVQSRFGNPR